MKLFRPRFNQREGTPQTELRSNPVHRYAHCSCLDAQYEDDRCGEDEDHEKVKWRELLLHTEVQDTSSEAWSALEAYIDDVRANGSDELNPIAGIGVEKW